MGLCTSKSTVTLDPSAHVLDSTRPSGAGGHWESLSGTPILDQGVLMVQPAKNKSDPSTAKSGRGAHQAGKGYLELGGKGTAEGEAQTSRDPEDDDDEEERDGVEEMVNFSHSEGSLQSEFLELS